MKARSPTLVLWLMPIVLAFVLSFVLMIVGRLGDAWVAEDVPHLEEWLWVSDPEVARAVILAMLEVLAGVFAISITVVAIIVQLSATRYTSRVVDLFLADKFNAFIFFAYVVPLIYGLWLATAIDGDAAFARPSVVLFVVLSSLAVVLVIPYFKFVFYFLQPSKIIDTIERSVAKSLQQAMDKPATAIRARGEASNSLRQLSDIAISSVHQSDTVLAMQALDSIKNTALIYIHQKSRLPEEWFHIGRYHIAGLSEEMWGEVVQQRTWMELEIFKQYEVAFVSSLRKVRDVNSTVSRSMREMAEAASVSDSDDTLRFFIKGMNTLIMYALSERDIRTAVHVLYQYRQLAEALLYRPDILEMIASHLKYYGQNSQRRRIFFILDAVAYDLRILIEKSFDRFPDSAEVLMRVFLELDQAAENQEDLAFLRGVRKSQAMLAGFFIRAERLDLAKQILDDMATESREFLQNIRRELFRTTTREFWEIEDRGVSFFYVEEEHRPSVERFFAWLLGERPLPAEIAKSA